MYDSEAVPAPFAGLQPRASDPLLSLIKLHRDDPRAQKIDLGVGVYRTAEGDTPVFQAVKAAEGLLLEDQRTKAYLGPEGDVGFLEALTPIVFGETARFPELIAVQTPGGTGALRLAAELVAAGGEPRRVWLGAPSWPIHPDIFRQAGLEVCPLTYFEPRYQAVAFDHYLSGLGAAGPGDVVLLHGACHNPTGADLTADQWGLVADLLERTGAVPLIDLAYQGLGDGLDADVAGLRQLVTRCENVIVAQSCDKNFGLYRERTGALFVRTTSAARGLVQSNLLQLARCIWSMPPDHGAAVAGMILRSTALVDLWRSELRSMRMRLNDVRTALADAHPKLAALGGQRGLFALLPLDAASVESLRRDHAIYMASSGRINVAGLNTGSIERFVHALSGVL